MRLYLLLVLTFFFFTCYAQDYQQPSVNIGDMAPPLKVQEWLKGRRVDSFEKGKVYVVEFWATWCHPCIAGMPRLSALARKYRNKITFIGIDIYEHYESINTPLPRVKRFVDSMGKRMNYNVAAEDSNFMETDWMIATGAKDEGIPRTFVVNAEGKLAWIGHPEYLSSVLPKILNNTWNVKEALATRVLNKYLENIDDSLSFVLIKYQGDEIIGKDYKHYEDKPNDPSEPDSILFVINQAVQNEPRLKYAPLVAGNTFSALLETNLHKAYEYGKIAMVTPSYEDPAYDAIIDVIQSDSDKSKYPAEIYELGAEAYEQEINHIVYPKLVRVYKHYQQMAEWYWLAGDKSKAIYAEHKAIKTLKRRKNFAKTDLFVLKHQLKVYKQDSRFKI